MCRMQSIWGVLVTVLLLVSCRRPDPSALPPQLASMQIDSQKGVIVSKPEFESGKLYSVVVSGFITYTSDSRAWMDAQNKYVLDRQRQESVQSFLIDGQPLPAGQSNLDQHVYLFYYVASGQSKEKHSIKLKIDDDNVRDNSSYWEVRIYDGYLAGLPDDLLQAPVYKIPAKVEVQANQGWQDTPIHLERDQPLKVTSITGQVTDGVNTLTDGVGLNELCQPQSACCGPKPEVRRDALIGRVGQDVFLIGVSGDFVTHDSGLLQLRLNDCDAGLLDNQGSLTVEIQP